MTNYNTILAPGNSLHEGDTVTSPLGIYKLTLSAGNLQLKETVSPFTIAYNSSSGGHPGATCTMVAASGDLEISVGGGAPFFESHTTRINSSLEVTDDGHVCIYDPAGDKLWDNGVLLPLSALYLKSAKEALSLALALIERTEQELVAERRNPSLYEGAPHEAAFSATEVASTSKLKLKDGQLNALRSGAASSR